MSIFSNKPKKSISNNSESNSEKNTDNSIEITPSVKETIIKFNMNEIETERIKNKKQIHTSPIIRRTPNTKTDIIIQKIYSNRRNIIKNINSKKSHFRNFTDSTANAFASENNQENEINLSQAPNNLNSKASTQFKQANLTKSLLSSSNLLSYPLTSINSELSHNKVDKVFIETEITDDKNNLYINSTDNVINNNINNNTSDQNNSFTTVCPNNDLNINNPEYEKSSPSTDISSIRQSENRIQNKLASIYTNTDETRSSSITSDNSEENYNSFSYPYEKKKRKHYKNVKMKKYIKELENKGSSHEYVPSAITNDNIFVPTFVAVPTDVAENQYDITSSKKNTPLSSPRTDSNELWNETIENYYIEFQKICKDESKKYKCLSNYNEIISKILKFLLLVSGCFTFTLSITVPNSSIMTTTTTISSISTAIITSIIGFFQFEKTSEIQYNIYKELDKLYSIISLELLKPTYMRNDPYELILLIQNRRDELLKTLHKK